MPNSLKEKILESIDIVDVVGERVSLTRKGRDFVGLCPFHDDHNPSLSVSQQKQLFKCWSCGAGGDVFKFVQLAQRVEFKDALDLLARRAGIEVRSPRGDKRSAEQRDQIRRALTWARAHFQKNLSGTPAGKRAVEYAHHRGMTDDTIEHFGLGYAANAWDDLLGYARRANIPVNVLDQAGLITSGESGKRYDRFRDRLIFPINDALGRCVAFGGRTLGDDPAKYLNSPETPIFSKSRILYGLDVARPAITASREAVVVEGYTDAVLLHQARFTNVVATLGTALTDAHIKLLSPLSDRLVMCFDNDEAGLRAADRAVETALCHRIKVVVAIMPDGEDPADVVIGRGSEAFKRLLQSALEALEFGWKRTVEAYSEREGQGQRDAVEAFLRFIARVTLAGGMDALDQGLLVGRLSELVALPAGAVYELLAKAKNAAARESASRRPDTSESSTYEGSTRGLPSGLVSAVEEAFGLALAGPEEFSELREGLAAGAPRYDAWGRLYAIMEGLVGQQGSYARADVIERCDDSVLCELVSRASARAGSRFVGEEMCRVVNARILSELEVSHVGRIRGQLRGVGSDGDEQERAFRSLKDVARRQPGVLAVGHRGQGAP